MASTIADNSVTLLYGGTISATSIYMMYEYPGLVKIGIDIGKTARSASYILERIFVAIWRSRNIWKGFYHLLY